MRTLWFITLLLTALLMGLTFAHTLEMPQKLSVDGPTWLNYQHTLYRYFAIVGGPIEIAAIIAAAALAFATRHNHTTAKRTIAAAIMLALSFLGPWVGVVRPVNAKTATWTPTTIPETWERARLQWELGHTVAFIMQMLAFSLLLLAIIPPPKADPTAPEIPKSKK